MRCRPLGWLPWQARRQLWPGAEESEGGPAESCAILTTEANGLVRPVQDRMPVILPERHRAAWLDTGLQDAAELVMLLRPCPPDAMRAHPVGSLVNHSRNDGPSCLASV